MIAWLKGDNSGSDTVKNTSFLGLLKCQTFGMKHACLVMRGNGQHFTFGIKQHTPNRRVRGCLADKATCLGHRCTECPCNLFRHKL
jgi:hypothetical protein